MRDGKITDPRVKKFNAILKFGDRWTGSSSAKMFRFFRARGGTLYQKWEVIIHGQAR
nr:MAG TPA: hypothetical protein [Caudoviricetes sp.]